MAKTGVRHLTVLASDGLALSVEDAGPKFGTSAHPILCLAGLTRNKSDFYDLRDYFVGASPTPRRVVLMDTRGRGGSQWAEDASTYTVQHEVSDAIQVACALGLKHVIVVGTSRGGMLAMAMAILRPGLMSATVLNDIGPRIAGAGLARLKKQLPSMSIPSTWPEATARVRQSMSSYFPAFDEADWERYARQTFADKDGVPAQAFDAEIVKPLGDIPEGLPFLDLSGPFKALVTRPTLLIRGELSDLLDIEGTELAESLGAESVTVEGQGHAPALRGDVVTDLERFFSDNHL